MATVKITRVGNTLEILIEEGETFVVSKGITKNGTTVFTSSFKNSNVELEMFIVGDEGSTNKETLINLISHTGFDLTYGNTIDNISEYDSILEEFSK